MIYEVDVIDPQTSQEQTIKVEITAEQNAVARASSDWMREIQMRACLPQGFMPIGRRVRPLPMAAIN
jgi:hypothetical protein